MTCHLRLGLQAKLLATHLLVLAVGAATLVLTIGWIAPQYFDRLMVEVAGPQMRALGHEMTAEAEEAMKQLAAEAFRQAVVVSLLWAGEQPSWPQL